MVAWVGGWYAALGSGMQSVLTLSWQASVLVLIVLAVHAVFGRWLSPRWRYALWSVVVLRLMLPVTPGSAVSVFNLFRGDPGAETEVVMDAAAGLPTVSVAAPVEAVDSGRSEPVAYAAGVGAAEPIEPVEPVSPVGSWSTADIMLSAWLAGSALVLGVLLLINVILALRLRRGVVLNDPGVLDLVEACKREMGVRRAVRLIVDRKITSPALAGVFRPTLLVPPGLLDELPREELRFILLHELAHVKKHDIAMNWLLIALSALHWFNPLIWFSFARLRADRELARDAMVLRAVGTEASQAYGQTIIRVLERLARPGLNNPAVAGIGDGMGQLKRRLRMIALSPKRRPALTVVGVVLLATLIAIGLTDAAQRVIVPGEDFGTVAEPDDTADFWNHALAYTAGAGPAIDFIAGEDKAGETGGSRMPVDAGIALLREAYLATIDETQPREKAIAFYKQYLTENPNGLFVAEANFRIGQLYSVLDKDVASSTPRREIYYYIRARGACGGKFSMLNIAATSVLADLADALLDKKIYYNRLIAFQRSDDRPRMVFPYRSIASTLNGAPVEWSLAERERIAAEIGERLGSLIEAAEQDLLDFAKTNPDHLRDLVRVYPDTSLGREAEKLLESLAATGPAGAGEAPVRPTGFLPKISYSFYRISREQAVEQSRDKLEAPLLVNWEALEAAGMDREYTLQMSGITPNFRRQFLEMLKFGSRARGPDAPALQMIDGVLHASTRRDLGITTETRAYDIRDLLGHADVSPPPVPQARPGGVPGSGQSTQAIAVDEVTGRIHGLVGFYEDWEAHGGDYASTREENGTLTVKTTPEGHKDIEGFLASLRAGLICRVGGEGRIIVAPEYLFEGFGSVPGAAHTGDPARVSILDDLEAERIIKAMQTDPAAATALNFICQQYGGHEGSFAKTEQITYVGDYKRVEKDGVIEYEPVEHVVTGGAELALVAIISDDRRSITLRMDPYVATIAQPIDKVRWAGSPPGRDLFIETPVVSKADNKVTVSVPDKGWVLVDVGMVTGPMSGDAAGDESPVGAGVERRVYVLVKPRIVLEAMEPYWGG